MDLQDILRALLGLALLIGFAFLFSSNKRKIDWRLVGIGLALQITFAVLITEFDLVARVFKKVSEGFVTFLGFSDAGAGFIFGNLIDPSQSWGFIFAFKVLPTIIFFSTVTAGLYYLGILQKIVFGIAWVMARTMRLSGAESLSAAGNIFLGQTEAPLLVRPFVPKMTRSELMCLMTGGMATIAGGVLAGFVAMLGTTDAEKATFAFYLLSASILNAPAAIIMSKIIIPETEHDKIDKELKVNSESLGENLIDALSRGAADGLKLALNVGGMLLAFIAIIAALNYFLIAIGGAVGLNEKIVASTGGQFSGFSLEYILGQIFRVFAWVMGAEWKDTLLVGSLLGQKTVINEFVAYQSLSENLKAGTTLSPKSIVIATYALCGFSNFSSIAIQVGGIGGMAPNQQGALSKLGFRALLAATLACMMTATIAGALMTDN